MLNKVILVGRLTADPQYSQTPQGTAVCRFSVAVDRPFVSKQTGQREADFINVVAWRQTADFVNRFFHKGSVIIVEGSLRNDNYERDGVRHYSMNVQADNVSFAGSRAETNSGGNGGFNANTPPSNSYNSGNGYGNSYNTSGDGSGYNSGSNGGYNGNYNNNNFSNIQSSNGNSGNGSQGNSDNSLGDLGDFEEIISDGEVPF